MKVNKRFFLFFSFLYITSCKTSDDRIIILDNELIVHGVISKDSIYNGYIQFYNFKTGKLLYDGFYKNGIEDGVQNYYYPNGKIKITREFLNGKVLGNVRSYDSTGTTNSVSYIYYNLPVGPNTQYIEGKLKRYTFSSFDNETLFYIDYDSIVGKKITDFQRGFFFKIEYNKTSVSSINEPVQLNEFLLYLPQPPRYNFSYELVVTNQHYKVIRVVKKFIKELVWETFTLPPLDINDAECKYAIKLIINDSTNNSENTMFKFLPTSHR